MNSHSDLTTQITSWLSIDPDPKTKAELAKLRSLAESPDKTIAIPALEELIASFSQRLSFGTAGLRGKLGPGPARMNRVVVSQTAAGFASWLVKNGYSKGKVIIGFDARFNSDVFAKDSAEILAGAGFEVLLCNAPTPTPLVSFAIRHYGCVAGIMVTASHNPPEDNGYKVYLSDGSQIVSPIDKEIENEITDFTNIAPLDIPRKVEYKLIGKDLVDAYCTKTASLIAKDAPRTINWVYTAMHGVGTKVMYQVAQQAGFPEAIPVKEQLDPDPTFPTVPFPNPEEPGAIDLSIKYALENNADLVIANDPDADRLAIAAPINNKWRMLSGDELGSLIGFDFLNNEVTGSFASSIVSSTLLPAMVRTGSKKHVTTLTGFKWIGRVPNLAFGYEEAIGYCCDSTSVPDKDGISAALTVLRIAAQLKAAGSSISAQLDKIALTYGIYYTNQLSFRVSDLSIISNAMDRLRCNPPNTLLGQPVITTDLSVPTSELPASDAIIMESNFVRAVIRPSGTEPKLKCYLQVHIPIVQTRNNLAAARASAETQTNQLRQEISALLAI